jgi:hypothetical protein
MERPWAKRRDSHWYGGGGAKDGVSLLLSWWKYFFNGVAVSGVVSRFIKVKVKLHAVGVDWKRFTAY